ncbi:PilN domain-containing protein [Suttonella ornithocola]|uniref:Fimbrial assembly protein (PilN) n=1 Tax=Suttonella ornithocola TaxID=279832 RepID=A0A380N057_9GAMM|nr:PilN domain-containing protein [Suttonella ornithocola]SUO97301.1 Fimbrial assembly protein (PilN) [Suttonella ornithocola]
MARKFNLQPWRAQLREQQKKQFITISMVTALVTAGLCFGYYFYKKTYKEDQDAAISTLNNEIASLKKAEQQVNHAKKLQEEVTKQILVIQGLQNQRSLTVEILNYLATKTPESVFINAINFTSDVQKGSSILTIEGVAENESGVASFMSILQKFPKFSQIRLDTMKRAESNERYNVTDNTGVRTFTLVVTVLPNSPIELNLLSDKE